MKVYESKQYLFIRKLRYYPGGNTLRESMSSLLDAGCNDSGKIFGQEGHMF